MRKMTPVIFIVDDDEKFRKSLERLVKSIGYKVEAFASAREFLQRSTYEGPSCLLLDVRMPRITGPDLQVKLSKREITVPIIFLTAHMDMHTGVQAMKDGAIDFLLKPFEEQALFKTIDKALDKNVQLIKERNEIKRIKKIVAALTPRELVVFRWVIAGMLNKNIALEAKITERTVKAHRSQIMKKFKVASVAELVRFALKAGISPAKKSFSS
jgi:two-component system response regulator FixJ